MGRRKLQDWWWDMKCPKALKDCQCHSIARAKGNNFICAGVMKTPNEYGDIVRLCVRGAVTDRIISEMTPKEAIGLCCVLSAVGYNNL